MSFKELSYVFAQESDTVNGNFRILTSLFCTESKGSGRVDIQELIVTFIRVD